MAASAYPENSNPCSSIRQHIEYTLNPQRPLSAMPGVTRQSA